MLCGTQCCAAGSHAAAMPAAAPRWRHPPGLVPPTSTFAATAACLVCALHAHHQPAAVGHPGHARYQHAALGRQRADRAAVRAGRGCRRALRRGVRAGLRAACGAGLPPRAAPRSLPAAPWLRPCLAHPPTPTHPDPPQPHHESGPHVRPPPHRRARGSDFPQGVRVRRPHWRLLPSPVPSPSPQPVWAASVGADPTSPSRADASLRSSPFTPPTHPPPPPTPTPTHPHPPCLPCSASRR